MKIVFITYGNSTYEKSKQRIIKEAQNLNLFNQIIAYGPDNLSNEIKLSPLFQYKKGGGYWIWKSYIIKETLKKMDEGDILFYADAGCSLFPSKQWEKYFSYLKKTSILVFKINCLNYRYIKNNVINAFKKTNGNYWHYSYQIAATTFFIKKNEFTTKFIEEWCNYCTPEFILDVPTKERIFENKKFIDHRHDQAIFTALIYKYYYKHNIKIKWNDFEAKRKNQAIRASRISDFSRRSNNKENKIKNIIRYTIILPLRNVKQFFWISFNNLYKKSL